MKVNIVNKSEFELPQYETSGSVGLDLRANIKSYWIRKIEGGQQFIPTDHGEKLYMKPFTAYTIPTGIYIAMPNEVYLNNINEKQKDLMYECQIRARSGLAAKHGITVLNGIGSVDSDYRGEIMVILIKLTEGEYVISHGDRIAQMVFNQAVKVNFNLVDELDSTDRNEGGFGSTGK